MKINYLSDLHMEFRDNMRYVKSNFSEISGDILVIAGDIGYINDTTIPNMRVWKDLSKNFRHVLMVPGNHEYYNNGDIVYYGSSFQKMFSDNIGYYHNKVVRIDNVDFILSTLWSRIPVVDEFVVMKGMNDYSNILYDKHRLKPSDITSEFEKNFDFIQKSVDKSDADKIVVVTHHLPSYALIREMYKNDVLNSAYATELGNYIADSRIDLWIYGHNHCSNDYMIGNTRLISNPLGYIGSSQEKKFNIEAFVEI